MFKIKSLPAYDGDSFIINIGDENNIKNIIIDGGRTLVPVKKLKEEIEKIISLGQKVDLLILTHIDNDHIDGLIKLFQEKWITKDVVQEVWFNSKKLIGKNLFNEKTEDELIKIHLKNGANISFKQGMTFEKRLENLKLEMTEIIKTGDVKNFGDITIRVLSPTTESLKILYRNWTKYLSENKAKSNISAKNKSDYKKSICDLLSEPYDEDKAPINATSIAIEVEYKDKKILLLADAHPSVVIRSLQDIHGESLKKINYDLIKLPHHGSKKNINEDFIKLLTSKKYLISTNGSTNNLPNKETLVKIAANNNVSTFYFNYPNVYSKFFTKDEMKSLNITCKEGKNNEIMEVDVWNCLEN